MIFLLMIEFSDQVENEVFVKPCRLRNWLVFVRSSCSIKLVLQSWQEQSSYFNFYNKLLKRSEKIEDSSRVRDRYEKLVSICSYIVFNKVIVLTKLARTIVFVLFSLLFNYSLIF